LGCLEECVYDAFCGTEFQGWFQPLKKNIWQTAICQSRWYEDFVRVTA